MLDKKVIYVEYSQDFICTYKTRTFVKNYTTHEIFSQRNYSI